MINNISKIFINSCLLAIKNNSDITFTGTTEQITAIKEAITATKNYNDLLMNEDTSLSDVLDALIVKDKAATNFRNVIGTCWVF